MGTSYPPVTGLALTLILVLGSSTTARADELIPGDIAFNPPASQPATAESDSLEPAPPKESPENVVMDDESPAEIVVAPEKASTNCSPNQGLRKTLSISRFTRENPQTANAGNLYEVEQGVAALFQQHLQRYSILRSQLLPMGVVHSSDERQQQQYIQGIARRMGTQFVLQGSIADMSMNHPESLYNPGHYRRLANWFHDLSGIQTRDKRLRHFVVNLVLRDGYTGETLFAQQYHTTGFWPERAPVGFNSAKFRNSDYAQKINKLVAQASESLAKTIDCQPFMVSIDAPPGRTQVILAGGANHGLHAGDELELYQLIVSPSNTTYMLAETRMVKRNTRVQLTEVYPSHSTAVIPDGDYLNGAFIAVSD